jgi:hypothetical protein
MNERMNELMNEVSRNIVACLPNIYAFSTVLTGYFSLNRFYIASDDEVLIVLLS